MISVVQHQFTSPKFVHFIQYSFYAAWYYDDKPLIFITPPKYCLCISVVNEGCHLEDCQRTAHIKWAFCDYYYCLEHFLFGYENHECYREFIDSFEEQNSSEEDNEEKSDKEEPDEEEAGEEESEEEPMETE